ncbi:MAG: chemotaxis protein CheW [Myxococcales bacterium]|nr:chemotaxis protein CheW [Myxococcales bacterium]MCB9645008.1 chemotaxis protein CheW [Deltaproteobacteria bacterium]
MQEQTAQNRDDVAAGPASGSQLLTFLLAGEEYGVDILRVQEIRGWDSATLVPNTPPYIKGIINIRGSIVPVLDLRLRFGLPAVEYGPTTVVIVVKVEGATRAMTVGLVVDAVSDVFSLATAKIQPPPEFGGDIDINFISGLITSEERLIVVLAVDGLLGKTAAVAEAPHALVA